MCHLWENPKSAFRTFLKTLVVARIIFRVGQNRTYTPYMTVYLVISLPKIPYIHRIYMVLANPIILCTSKEEVLLVKGGPDSPA